MKEARKEICHYVNLLLKKHLYKYDDDDNDDYDVDNDVDDGDDQSLDFLYLKGLFPTEVLYMYMYVKWIVHHC